MCLGSDSGREIRCNIRLPSGFFGRYNGPVFPPFFTPSSVSRINPPLDFWSLWQATQFFSSTGWTTSP